MIKETFESAVSCGMFVGVIFIVVVVGISYLCGCSAIIKERADGSVYYHYIDGDSEVKRYE